MQSVSHLICNHFSRKVVLEKWICKLRFFSGWRPRKKSKFAEPLFQTSGCRLKFQPNSLISSQIPLNFGQIRKQFIQIPSKFEKLYTLIIHQQQQNGSLKCPDVALTIFLLYGIKSIWVCVKNFKRFFLSYCFLTQHLPSAHCDENFD